MPGKSVENIGQNTASLDAPGSVEGTTTVQPDGGSMIDYRKAGKAYERDADVKNVIANEMLRIHKAFDVKLTEHTENCIATVNSGKPLVEKEQSAPNTKKK